VGATIDEAFGAAGLGLTGVGEGGGSSGEGIGLDAIGTLGVSGIGHDAGFGPGGIGRYHGRLAKGHAPRAPQFRVGETTIQGRLPGEIVQRIVRQITGDSVFATKAVYAITRRCGGASKFASSLVATARSPA
jgi:hypothetical protein